MNRINELFSRKHHDILSLYFCAGSPTLEGTATVIKTLEQKGIDMIEIGIPFSDPMADGVVIQNAATQALRNGMTLWGIERSGFFNGQGKWAKGFENQMV